MCFMHFFYFALFCAVYILHFLNRQQNKVKFSSGARLEIRNEGGLFWGSGGGAPSARNFAFFCKNSLILEVF